MVGSYKLPPVKFSIATISFNQAAFLERAIKSVIGQVGADVDYVVVDPGSTDGSRNIIERYRNKIASVVFENDKGPADGLNKGFARARGDIFGYLNSDDFYLPGALGTVASFFERYPDADVVTGHGYVVDAEGRPLRRFRSPPFDARRFAYGHSYVLQQSTFFRCKAFEEAGGFNIANRTSWDGELILTMALQGARIKVIPAYLSAFTVHPGSITGSGATEAESRRNHDRYFEMIMGRKRMGRDQWLARAALARKYLADPLNPLVRLLDVTVGPRLAPPSP
jgi:glycosyltransferase involved in cell wall biosynthesis